MTEFDSTLRLFPKKLTLRSCLTGEVWQELLSDKQKDIKGSGLTSRPFYFALNPEKGILIAIMENLFFISSIGLGIVSVFIFIIYAIFSLRFQKIFQEYKKREELLEKMYGHNQTVTTLRSEHRLDLFQKDLENLEKRVEKLEKKKEGEEMNLLSYFPQEKRGRGRPPKDTE